MHRLKFPVVVIFFIILAVPAQGAVLLDRVVAVVNQDVITWSELYKTMEMDASPEVKAMSPEEKRKVFKKEESSFLENLINVKLELQQAQSDGMTVTDGEVQEAINNIKRKYSMSDSDLASSLKKEGYSLKDYRKRLREQILVSKAVDRDIRSKIVLSDSDVSKYISQNRKALEGNRGYRISQIFFKMPKKKQEMAVMDEKADAIVKRIRDGESFSDLAKEYSEDPSASSGGDLGYIKKDQLSKKFIETIAGMKTGDVSNPFWTVSGLHIIKLVEKPGAKSKGEIDAEARDELSRKLFNAKYDEWIKSLRAKAFIDVKL